MARAPFRTLSSGERVVLGMSAVEGMRSGYAVTGGGVNLPGGDEHGGNEGADDEAVDAEDSDAAECGNTNEAVGQRGVFANELGTHEVVDKADDKCAEEDQNDATRDRANGDEVNGNGQPDESGAYCGKEGKNGHDGAPEERALNPKNPKDEAAEAALN